MPLVSIVTVLPLVPLVVQTVAVALVNITGLDDAPAAAVRLNVPPTVKGLVWPVWMQSR